MFSAGDYSVSASLDANGNGNQNAGEPASTYPLNPVTVAAPDVAIVGIDVSLGGTYGISGRVAYENGIPVYNVTMLLSGPVNDATTTNTNGNYTSTDLAEDSCLATPSSTTKYFYPYDRTVVVSGGDSTGVDFEAHNLPSGDVDGEIIGTVTTVDAANHNLTADDGGGPITLYVYAATNLAVEVDSLSGG